jgi:hypothetical protein
MKFASSFGRYEEEWKDGDWNVNGEVPVMMISSRIQLPTETPPQLIPPTKLPAKDSRRGFSLFEPITEMGFVPFPHWDILALRESFRAAAAL